jgi:hypothetical protein
MATEIPPTQYVVCRSQALGGLMVGVGPLVSAIQIMAWTEDSIHCEPQACGGMARGRPCLPLPLDRMCTR